MDAASVNFGGPAEQRNAAIRDATTEPCDASCRHCRRQLGNLARRSGKSETSAADGRHMVLSRRANQTNGDNTTLSRRAEVDAVGGLGSSSVTTDGGVAREVMVRR